MIITAKQAKAISENAPNAHHTSVEERLAHNFVDSTLSRCIELAAEEHKHMMELTFKMADWSPASASSGYWTPQKFFGGHVMPGQFNEAKYQEFIRKELKLFGYGLQRSLGENLQITW